MKKQLAIFFLVVYTSTVFGIAFNFHYCRGHLEKVSLLNISDQVGCSCIPGNMPKDCCKNFLIVLKVDSHKIAQSSSTAVLIPFPVEPFFSNNDYIFTFRSAYAPHFESNNARQSSPECIYLLNRVFRI